MLYIVYKIRYLVFYDSSCSKYDFHLTVMSRSRTACQSEGNIEKKINSYLILANNKNIDISVSHVNLRISPKLMQTRKLSLTVDLIFVKTQHNIPISPNVHLLIESGSDLSFVSLTKVLIYYYIYVFEITAGYIPGVFFLKKVLL